MCTSNFLYRKLLELKCIAEKDARNLLPLPMSLSLPSANKGTVKATSGKPQLLHVSILFWAELLRMDSYNLYSVNKETVKAISGKPQLLPVSILFWAELLRMDSYIFYLVEFVSVRNIKGYGKGYWIAQHSCHSSTCPMQFSDWVQNGKKRFEAQTWQMAWYYLPAKEKNG